MSIPGEDIRLLDACASAMRDGSRSAAGPSAARSIRATELVSAYEEAFVEWAHSDSAVHWDATAVDRALGPLLEP